MGEGSVWVGRLEKEGFGKLREGVMCGMLGEGRVWNLGRR